LPGEAILSAETTLETLRLTEPMRSTEPYRRRGTLPPSLTRHRSQPSTPIFGFIGSRN